MDLAFLLFQKVLVMLAFLIIGCVCYKIKFITDEGNKSVTNLVMYIFTPAMILVSFQQEFSMKLLKGLGVTMALSCVGYLLIVIVTYLLIRKKGFRGKVNPDCEIHRFAAIYSNCGFMGIPLASELFGPEGVFYITAFHSVFTLLVWTHGVYLITGSKKDISIKKVILNPSVIATIVGIVLFALNFKMPELLSSAMGNMSSSVGPLGMIIAGVAIAKSDVVSAVKNVRIYFVALMKLIVTPLILALVLTGVFRKLGVDETALYTTTLAFSCPTATIGTMFAIKFDKNAETSAQIYALTTVLSVVTMPLVIYLQSLI